ncbi:MAG TPA: isoprenylcysteine carboxylmethyltransferase family protein [Terriglobales bacterium]|nr:isoprenylcysteine carboxylmethyltransferase family protein [Terriglobales bacterium]
MIQFLHSFGWLACIVYSTIPSFWLLIHPHVNYWRSRSRSPYRFLLPLWIVMWIVVSLITATWRSISFYNTAWSWLPAAALFAAGITIYKLSGAGFSAKQLGGLPEILSGHHEQRLVTSGIRSRVRHPIYLAHFCEMLAWSIGTGLLVCYGLTAFAVVTGAVMIRMEDAELEQRFGEEYRRYRQKVPAALPRI